MSDTAITPAGLGRLMDELERLTTVARREVADRIRHAVSTDANPAENADYLDAREDQALLERRIAILEHRISAAEIVAPDADNDIVDVGERVRLQDLETGKTLEYELVGSLEADPAAGRISNISPLGQALLGRRQGEVAVVDAPRGRMRFQILAIGAVESAT
jgi:transcription elongation factor GreA